MAFYAPLATSQGPQAVLADDALRTLAREILRVVRENVTVDWTARENAKAHLWSGSSASSASTGTRQINERKRP